MSEASPAKRVLIVSHDASRTGGPILLLNFLNAVKQRNPQIEIDTIVGGSGPLIAEFSKLGRVLEMAQQSYNLPVRAWRKIRQELSGKTAQADNRKYSLIKSFTREIDYTVIFSNTIVNGRILEALQPAKTRIVSYVHELNTMIHRFTSAETLACALKYTDRFYVPSPVLAKNLVENHGVEPGKISLLRYYLPEIKVDRQQTITLKEELGIAGCFIIGAVGTSDWRKGTDLFLQIAIQVKAQSDQPVKFLWIGADPGLQDQQRLQHDIDKSGMTADIIFVESVSNVDDYISIMDIFVLTSREDPYPMVVLEAAMQRKPLMCFDGSGGVVEFVRKAANIVVPYLDTRAFANQILTLMTDTERQALGESAYLLCRELHSEQATLLSFEQALGI